MMGPFEDEKVTLARMKYAMAKEFGELVGRFARDLREEKNLPDKEWWGRFETAWRWFHDPENAEQWTDAIQKCHAYGEEGKDKIVAISGEIEEVIDMRPWKNKNIWQPLIKMLYADLVLKFKETGDMLSTLGFMTGYGLKERKPDLPATDLKRYFDSLRE